MKLYEFFSVPSVEQSEEKNLSKMTGEEREKVANELFWYILDNDDIHKKHFIPIAKQIQRDLKSKGKIDRKDFIDCWMPMVEAGCLEFHKDKQMPGNPRKVFDREFREGLCQRFSDQHLEDIKKKKYNLGD